VPSCCAVHISRSRTGRPGETGRGTLRRAVCAGRHGRLLFTSRGPVLLGVSHHLCNKPHNPTHHTHPHVAHTRTHTRRTTCRASADARVATYGGTPAAGPAHCWRHRCPPAVSLVWAGAAVRKQRPTAGGHQPCNPPFLPGAGWATSPCSPDRMCDSCMQQGRTCGLCSCSRRSDRRNSSGGTPNTRPLNDCSPHAPSPPTTPHTTTEPPWCAAARSRTLRVAPRRRAAAARSTESLGGSARQRRGGAPCRSTPTPAGCATSPARCSAQNARRSSTGELKREERGVLWCPCPCSAAAACSLACAAPVLHYTQRQGVHEQGPHDDAQV
jgi:hypothetical protein